GRYSIKIVKVLHGGDRILLELLIFIQIELHRVRVREPMIDSSGVSRRSNVIGPRNGNVAAGGSRLHHFVNEAARLRQNAIRRNSAIWKWLCRLWIDGPFIRRQAAKIAGAFRVGQDSREIIDRSP